MGRIMLIKVNIANMISLKENPCCENKIKHDHNFCLVLCGYYYTRNAFRSEHTLIHCTITHIGSGAEAINISTGSLRMSLSGLGDTVNPNKGFDLDRVCRHKQAMSESVKHVCLGYVASQVVCSRDFFSPLDRENLSRLLCLYWFYLNQ